ncbi:hypothetical protein [Novosphingobium huizhouense]|uniref:hypothetical protein n=1 Tax=Novosphingobium huizhouense TaxID=2866625 RepID=UPI001CD85B91|nr:hypothetical protein [Novosphingobium huizhouense]
MRLWRFLIVALLALAAAPAAAAPPPATNGVLVDQELYRAVTERVRKGENFYPATIAEQRARSYPAKPALAVRPPTLAYALALLPSTQARTGALILLLFAALIAVRRTLSDQPAPLALATIALTLTGLFGAFFPGAAYLHEQWSVLLLLLALCAARRPALMVGLAFLAVLVRETALAWLAAMVLVALWRRDWKLAGLATGAIAAAGALWLVHAHFAAAQVTAADVASPGWVRFQGLTLVIDALRRNLALYPLPGWLLLGVAAASLLAMLRWGETRVRIAAVGSIGFIAALTVLGREDNGYWGFMVAPFVLWGVPLLAARALARVRR